MDTTVVTAKTGRDSREHCNSVLKGKLLMPNPASTPDEIKTFLLSGIVCFHVY